MTKDEEIKELQRSVKWVFYINVDISDNDDRCRSFYT